MTSSNAARRIDGRSFILGFATAFILAGLLLAASYVAGAIGPKHDEAAIQNFLASYREMSLDKLAQRFANRELDINRCVTAISARNPSKSHDELAAACAEAWQKQVPGN
ncbi:MAG: hypothetical protein ABWY00_11975 [Dongiaceae bacterium]